MVVLMEIIAQATAMNDKVLIFSQRLDSLDFVERALMTKGWGGFLKTPPPSPLRWQRFGQGGGSGNDEACWGPWVNGREYFRLEGNSATRERCVLCLPDFWDGGC